MRIRFTSFVPSARSASLSGDLGGTAVGLALSILVVLGLSYAFRRRRQFGEL